MATRKTETKTALQKVIDGELTCPTDYHWSMTNAKIKIVRIVNGEVTYSNVRGRSGIRTLEMFARFATEIEIPPPHCGSCKSLKNLRVVRLKKAKGYGSGCGGWQAPTYKCTACISKLKIGDYKVQKEEANV